MAISDKDDDYAKLTLFYNYPKSEALRSIFETAFTPEQAKALVALPGTAEQVAAKIGRDKESVKADLEDAFQRGIVRTEPGPEETREYALIFPVETVHDEMCRHIGVHEMVEETREISDPKSKLLAILWQKWALNDWYRWQRPDELRHRRVEFMKARGMAGYTFGLTPAWKALEKSNIELPEDLKGWDAREAVKGAKSVFLSMCPCRVRARKCDLPVWTCSTYFEHEGEEVPHRHLERLKRGVTKRFTPQEWLDRLAECEEKGMVHTGILTNHFGCNCDTCCCNIFVALQTYATPAEGLDKSPFRSVVNTDVCEGCPDCVEWCRFGAIDIVDDPATGKKKAVTDLSKCFGCGMCVTHCKVPGAISLVLADDVKGVAPGLRD